MAATSTKQKRILIIEDDVFLTKAYQVKFQNEGFEVQVAVDGKEALSLLQNSEPPDVVLLDIMLPGVDGFAVLGEIRKNEKWKKVPVIISSNLGQEKDIGRGKELGAQDYIVKAEVKISDVVDRVKKYL